ncbi:MAG TPA: hypothetical protein LFV92_02045 [Rickettsia endosymbiont of Ceroptres masudai]|nr:hypothetical protein [Rickettsia endosymbiont of Ceroptres masudai]
MDPVVKPRGDIKDKPKYE